MHPDGYGTIFGGGEGPDIYIDRKLMKGAMNGDLVIVRVDKRNPQFSKLRDRDLYIGEVIKVLSRAHRTVVGRFHAHPTEPYVVPFDFRIDTTSSSRTARRWTRATARWSTSRSTAIPTAPRSLASGRVVEVLGFIGEPGVDIEVVIRKLHIPHTFPAEVLARRGVGPDRGAPKEIAKRVDLRERNIVTIDGETAKDFDDAVEVALLPNGNYLLGVHIADVAHYVTEGSALDRRGVRARHVGLLPRPRRADAARAPLERHLLAATRASSG